MTADSRRWEKVGVLFERALETPPERRAAFLDDVCGTDTRLRAELASLLEAYQQAPRYFDSLAGDVVAPSLAALAEKPRVGAQLGGVISHYELRERLGDGGMGVVYRARDLRLDRTVALKFLSFERTEDREARARLLREAQAASALDDPHICTIYGIEETPDGQTFIAMAFYEGETLKDIIARGALPIAQFIDLSHQIAQGLAHAHQHGIIHRDLKPANVMVTTEGRVKLLDFGLARRATAASLTKPGTTLGTLAYMSPEQARGQDTDSRTDVWSLGVVFYEMLTGQRPFWGDNEAAILYQILESDPQPIATLRTGVPDAVARLVDGMLRKDRGERLADVRHVVTALRPLGGATATSRPFPDATPASATIPTTPHAALARRHWPTRRRVGVVVGSALLLLGGTWGLMRSREAPSTRRTSVARSAIAVLPFSVRGSGELAYLREGMVDLLSTKLNGANGLRSIEPNAVLGFVDQHITGVLDPERGREVAARFGASHYVLGSVLQLGDRVQLNASLYDALGAEQARREVVVRREAELPRGIDDLAHQLVSDHLKGPDQRLAGLAAMTTPSFSALRAYLEGEQLLRDGRPYAAVEVLQRAVALDSTFALAWYGLARAAGWTNTDSLNRIATSRALRYSRQLGDHARAVISAYHVFRTGDPAQAERLYRSIVASHPDDMETWLLLGETLFHNNPFYGRSTAEAEEPLRRALAFDPHNREILIHLMELAAKDRRLEELDTLTARFLRPMPDGERPGVRHAYRALRSLMLGDGRQRQRVFSELENAGPDALQSALYRIAPQLGEISTAERLARSLSAPAHPGRIRAIGYLHQALFEIARGRWRAAETAWQSAEPLSPGWTLVHRTLAYALPHAPVSRAELISLREELGRWDVEAQPLHDGLHAGELDDVRAFLRGMLSWRLGDLAAAEAAAERLTPPAAQGDARLRRSFAKTLEALVAWQRGEETKALVALDQAQLGAPFPTRVWSPLSEQHLNRYLRGELLIAAGRHAEAVPWYTSLYDGYFHWGVPYLGPAYLRRAEIYERRGDRERAAAYYARFVELWRECDPELRPMLHRAQLEHRRLTDDLMYRPSGGGDAGQPDEGGGREG